MPAPAPNTVASCEDELYINFQVLPLNWVVTDGINRRVLRALPIAVDQESSSLLSFILAFILVINTSKKIKAKLKRCILFFTFFYALAKRVTYLSLSPIEIKSPMLGFSHLFAHKIRNELHYHTHLNLL